jgi:hypothetical protein
MLTLEVEPARRTDARWNCLFPRGRAIPLAGEVPPNGRGGRDRRMSYGRRWLRPLTEEVLTQGRGGSRRFLCDRLTRRDEQPGQRERDDDLHDGFDTSRALRTGR